MDQLSITQEVGDTLVNEYGYQVSQTRIFRMGHTNGFLAYPRAKYLMPVPEDRIIQPLISLEDILSLEMLDPSAWDAFLTKYDN